MIRPDPVLTAVMCAQRLVPVAAVGAYAWGVPPRQLIVVAAAAWLLAAAAGNRAERITRAALERGVTDAARGILARSAASMRGRAHDELLTVVWRGIDAREQLARDAAPSLVAAALALPLAFAVSARVAGLDVAATVLAAAGAFALVRAPLGRRYNDLVESMQQGYSRLARDMGHALRALEDVHAHGLGPSFQSRLEEGARAVAGMDACARRAGRIATWLPLAAGGAVFLAAMAATGRLGKLGALDLAALGALAPIAVGAARATVVRRRLMVEARPLDALAARAADVPPPARALPPPSSLVPMTFESVTFSYEGASGAAGARVFDRVTVRWNGQGALVLWGPNGSGKSTFVGLLVRLVDPSAGCVRLGGIDVRTIEPTTFRARIAYVAQRPLLLEGMTIAEAMRLVAPHAPDRGLLAALDRAGLLARLSNRAHPLEVPCAELSVGEAQRVAIARALVRDPAVVVFDEPEAALDPHARIELRHLIESLQREGRSVVLATQHEEVVPAGASRLHLPLPEGALVELG